MTPIFPTFLPISSKHAEFMVLIYDVTERVIVHNIIIRVEDEFPFYTLCSFLHSCFVTCELAIFLAHSHFFALFYERAGRNYRCAKVGSKGEEQRRRKQPEQRNIAAAFSNVRKIRAAQSYSLSYIYHLLRFSYAHIRITQVRGNEYNRSV